VVLYIYMDRYILDTNLFFNMQAGLSMGDTTEKVIVTMTRLAREGKSGSSVQLYMPPRIVEELLSFFENKEQPFLKEFLAEIIVKSPVIDSIQFPASVFYTLVDDIRQRSYRGLRVGEEEIEQAARSMQNTPSLSKMEFQKKSGVQIKGFRDRYRQATRFGFLESVADLDIIVLARELDATVVSTDEGLLKWSRLFGVKEMMANVFGQKMGSILLHHPE